MVIKDEITGREWPGEKTSQGELHMVQLLAKHKRRRGKGTRYQRIWYNPLSEDEPPKMVIRQSKPQGWEPWTVTPDSTWTIVQEETDYTNLRTQQCK